MRMREEGQKEKQGTSGNFLALKERRDENSTKPPWEDTDCDMMSPTQKELVIHNLNDKI